MSAKKGLLERLADGPVVGDGSFVMTLEKRGYVLAGKWTPEACLRYPDAGTCIGPYAASYTHALDHAGWGNGKGSPELELDRYTYM